MVKRLYILSLLVVIVAVSATTTVEAREFRYLNAKHIDNSTPGNSPKQIAPKPIAANSSVVVASAGAGSAQSLYASLLTEQIMLSDQIGVLSSQLQGASKSKAKKISSQINDMTAQLSAVERRIESFPESIRNPHQTVVEVDEEFNRQMDQLAAQLNAATDPFAGKISSDPELEAMYRKHLRESGSEFASKDGGSLSDKLTYRVMIAISRNALPSSVFAGLTDILEQRMNDGGVIYYQGSYATQSEAQQACDKILSQRKFRDAFVVAMEGDQRVPIK